MHQKQTESSDRGCSRIVISQIVSSIAEVAMGAPALAGRPLLFLRRRSFIFTWIFLNLGIDMRTYMFLLKHISLSSYQTSECEIPETRFRRTLSTYKRQGDNPPIPALYPTFFHFILDRVLNVSTLFYCFGRYPLSNFVFALFSPVFWL